MIDSPNVILDARAYRREILRLIGALMLRHTELIGKEPELAIEAAKVIHEGKEAP